MTPLWNQLEKVYDPVKLWFKRSDDPVWNLTPKLDILNQFRRKKSWPLRKTSTNSEDLKTCCLWHRIKEARFWNLAVKKPLIFFINLKFSLSHGCLSEESLLLNLNKGMIRSKLENSLIKNQRSYFLIVTSSSDMKRHKINDLSLSDQLWVPKSWQELVMTCSYKKRGRTYVHYNYVFRPENRQLFLFCRCRIGLHSKHQ